VLVHFQVGVELVVEPLLRFGCPVPFQVAFDRPGRAGELEAAVAPRRRQVLIDVEAPRRRRRSRPPGHAERRVAERGGDQVGDEAVRFQPVGELRV
jgi:hypothetical protein